MKIEMGESLFLSWLRHVKQCQIVQLNWKPSGSWDMSNENEIANLIQIYRDFIKSRYHRELFGKKSGQSHNQIIKQSEIDALGFELSGNKISSAYAIDVAFHEGGLNYGTREETVCRVVKKLVRSAMIMLGYFSVDNGEIIFASPKISPKVFSELKEIVQEVSNIANSNNLKFKFRLFGNEDFMDKVIGPVISLSNEVSDTSELFMRSVQLYQLFRNSDANARKSKPVSKEFATKATTDEIKIGQLVKSTFSKLFSHKKLTQEMLDNLQDTAYSKKQFGISYSVLKRINSQEPTFKQRLDNKGYARYWSHEFDNGRYLMCSQWYERHRENLIQWASQFE